MFSQKLLESYNSGVFNSLLDENIINEVTELETNNAPPSAVIVEKNFSTNSHKIFFRTIPDSGHFTVEDLESSNLQKKCIANLLVFENKILIEKAYGFDTLYLENSYDENDVIRNTIKLEFDKWNSYYKRFLDKVLNCFDGESDNYLNAVSFYKHEKTNSLICHEYPTSDYIRDRHIIENLCNLYNITETNQDLHDLNNVILSIKNILEKEHVKINYKLKFSKESIQEIKLNLYPIIHEERDNILTFILQSLKESNLIDIDVANQLNRWEENYRKLAYISLKLVKKDRLRLEVLASYGVI